LCCNDDLHCYSMFLFVMVGGARQSYAVACGERRLVKPIVRRRHDIGDEGKDCSSLTIRTSL
jgi:hypothetical protein